MEVFGGNEIEDIFKFFDKDVLFVDVVIVYVCV